MKKIIAAIFLGDLFFSLNGAAADLKQSKFTQVVNEVQIIASDKSVKPAVINDLFNIPDVLRTGAASRAELVADDHTITRVGANTIFSFDQASRTVDLQQGSLLFHSDKGKGGGTIRTGAATASVLGTTLIVVTTTNGGFKVLMLEGNGLIHFSNGKSQRLGPGQMTFVLPGGLPGPVLDFLLSDQISQSLLVQGFRQPLTSMPLINNVISAQNQLIATGKAVDTGLVVGDSATSTTVQVVSQDQSLSALLHQTVNNPVNSTASAVSATATYAGQDFSTLLAVNLSAHTVVLQNVQFAIGSTVDIKTDTGLLAPYPNTGAAIVPGDLNMVNGVTYGGLPAQNFITTTAGSPGIYSHPL
jgi:hypothetical protein